MFQRVSSAVGFDEYQGLDNLHSHPNLEIAVLIPCYNEEATVSDVVDSFRAALPAASIYVYDNNSSDNTIAVATAAGAIVRKETYQGKGNVVRRMFADIEADIYVLVDGDNTYDASAANKMISALIDEDLDLVNAVRCPVEQQAYRPGHQFGNRMISGMVGLVFGKAFSDVLSGYKVLSRRFVKSFPLLAGGFEIETELAVHAMELRMPYAEIETDYASRPAGSESKLSTYRDGYRIFMTIAKLTKEEKPLRLFLVIALILTVFAAILITPIFITFAETGQVPRFPTAILVTGLMLLAFLSIACGFILDTVTRGRQEAKRIAYLSIPRTLRGKVSEQLISTAQKIKT